MRSVFTSSAAMLLLVSSVVLHTHVATAADPVVFRYQAKPGDKQFYTTRMSMKQEQGVAGMMLMSTMNTAESVQREVMPADADGNINLRITSQHMRAAMMFGPLGEYGYDSKSKENETGSTLGAALTPMYDALSGAVIDVKINATGKVLKIAGLQQVLEGAIKNNPLAAQFGAGAASDEGARLTYQEFFLEFPDRAVSPGDSWDAPLEVALPKVGVVKGGTKITYVGVDSDTTLHKFQTTSDMTVDVDIQMNGIDVKGTMKMTASSGTILFDNQTGRIVKLNKSATIDGDLVASVGGMNVTVKQSQTQTYSAQLTDKPEVLEEAPKAE